MALGYPFALVLMVVSAILPFWFFRRRAGSDLAMRVLAPRLALRRSSDSMKVQG